MPGWWFTVESTTTKHLLRQFKSAIRAALESKPDTRAKMRARSALQRFPVAHWKEQLATMHEITIKVNQKSAIKHGLEPRGDYNTSLASSALPSSNASAAVTPPELSVSGSGITEEEDELEDLPQDGMGSCDNQSSASNSRKLSLGVRTGPGYESPSKASHRSWTNRKPLGITKEQRYNQATGSLDKRGSIISHMTMGTGPSGRASSPTKQKRRTRESTLRTSVANAFSRFRFGDFRNTSYTGSRLTGEALFDEKAGRLTHENAQEELDEVLVTPEQAEASKRMSMVASEQARLSARKSSETVQGRPKFLRNASVWQQPSDAYLALIGKSRKDGDTNQTSSGSASVLSSPHPSNPQTPVTPNFPDFSAVRDFATTSSPAQAQFTSGPGSPAYSPHPSNPRTPVTPYFPEFSAVRDFATSSSPTQAQFSSGSASLAYSPHPSNPRTPITPNFPEFSTVRDSALNNSPTQPQSPTATFTTRRGTITFGSPGGVTSVEHPVVDSHRFSYGTVLQGKKDYALQNVEPFFTDPTGLYYKAFHLELKDLNSKNSEGALCIEDFLTMSEKDWYNRLHKVRMGKRASRARPATIFYAPVKRQVR